MAKKGAYRKKPAYKKKRPARRARAGGPSGKALHLPGTLIPQHVTTKMKYVTTLQKSFPLLGKPGLFNQFRLNSIWDPDETSVLTGTSALGWIQYAQLYQRYRVYRCDYRISMTNLSEDTIVAGAIVVQNANDVSFSVSDYMRPLAKRFQLGNRSGSNKAVITGSIYLPKLAGESPVQYKTNPNNLSGFTTNPATPLNLTIVGNCTNGGVAASVAAQVDLTYHVELMATNVAIETAGVNGQPIVPESIYCT